MITRREGASGPLAPTPGDATGEAMNEKHWAYCPDLNDVCAIVIADAECSKRDAARIADLGKQLSDLHEQLRDVDTKRSRLLADCRDLERENAALRRRLREGGR